MVPDFVRYLLTIATEHLSYGEPGLQARALPGTWTDHSPGTACQGAVNIRRYYEPKR